MDDHSRLHTFLHGIEPRAWVFLHVHCDDPARADLLFRETIAQFARDSVKEPLARWPMRFWTTLLAQPGLTSSSEGLGDAGLTRMPPGPRAVFLLPMVAGLDEVHATEALGTSSHALARALVQARMAWPDTDAHERLRSLLQARIREPTASDRKAMAALRAEALGIEPAATTAEPVAPMSKSRRPTLLLILGAVILLALAWWALSTWSSRPAASRGHSEVLPEESLPPPPPLDATTIVTHPDYLALASPQDMPFARDLALLSWFDADMPIDAPLPPVSDDFVDVAEFANLPDAQRELLITARATWASLDAATRQRLMMQAADWLRRTQGERAALRQSMLEWDRLAIAERARLRAPFDAWLRLPESDRERLRLAAQRWSALPIAQQSETRARFDALSADSQRLWWLGPTLGRELAPDAARLAFLPEAERDEFLATLRGLDSRGRADFIGLSQRLPAGERERLRRDLQAQPPTQRNAWLQARRPQ